MGCIQTTCNPKLKGMKIQINNNIREQKKSLCDISGLDLTRPNQIQISHNKNNNTHYYYTHIVIILILIIIIIIYIWLIHHHRRKRRKQRKHQQQHQHRININNHISTIRTHVATSIDPLGTPMLTLEPS